MYSIKKNEKYTSSLGSNHTYIYIATYKETKKSCENTNKRAVNIQSKKQQINITTKKYKKAKTIEQPNFQKQQ